MPVLLKLECSDWILEVVGPLIRLPSFLAPQYASVALNGNAHLFLCSPLTQELEPVTTRSCQYHPLFFENTTYDFYLQANDPAIDLQLPPAASRRHRSGQYIHQALNFGNDVGYFEVRINSPDVTALRLEVFPTKVDYRQDYLQMRDEVSAFARNLAMAVQARTFALALPHASGDRTLNEWIELLRYYFGLLMKTGNAIAENPHSLLERVSETIPVRKSRRVDLKRLDRKLRTGAIKSKPPFSSDSRVPELKRRTTFNTPENRYIKHLLLHTAHNLSLILHTRSSGDEDAELTAEERFFQEFRQHALRMLQPIQRLLTSHFLKNLEPQLPDVASSAVMLKHPHYVRFFKLGRIFNGGLSLGGQVLQVGVKNIAVLYEYWCFLTLVKLLAQDFELEQQTLIRQHHTRLVVTLAKGREAGVRFRDRATGRFLYLIYDKAFRSLPTVAQRPDNVIQLASESRLHILDAKYRLAYDEEYQARYGGIGPLAEDINTMHRYRDAIVTTDDSAPEGFARLVVAASVLFPYPDEEKYKAHRFYSSLSEVRIGGLPFLPRTTALLREYLQELLKTEGYSILK